METICYTTIEELGLSVKLYVKLKRAGINNVGVLAKANKDKLLKSEVIELLEEFGVYHHSSTDSIDDFGCSDALYNRLKKLRAETIQDIPRVGYDKFSKPELIELLEEFGYYDSHQYTEED
jgi:DNA-directed RNA polymerase alpha subunit